MPKKHFWVSESQPEEQGSFSDVDSRHTYHHGNVTDVTDAEASAIDRGDEVVFLDAPIDQNVPYDIRPGQGFNMFRTKEDSQSVSTPPKHAPGH